MERKHKVPLKGYAPLSGAEVERLKKVFSRIDAKVKREAEVEAFLAAEMPGLIDAVASEEVKKRDVAAMMARMKSMEPEA